MTDKPDPDDVLEGLDWEPDVDLARLPHLIDGILDRMPDGSEWRARFVATDQRMRMHPWPPGWMTFTHDRDLFCVIHVDSFVATSDTARALVMVDGELKEMVLERQGEP